MTMTKTHKIVSNSNCSDSEMAEETSSDIFSKYKQTNSLITQNSNTSDEESAPVVRVKKRLQRFTQIESDTDQENDNKTNKEDKDSENETPNKISSTKAGITLNDGSESDDVNKSIKNEEQQLRMKNKRNKLRNKFKNLVTSRSKDTSKRESENEKINSDTSSDDDSSINNIKQGVKKSMLFKPSICDPDTSDEEGFHDKRERLVLQSQNQKKIKPTSPKPLRMTAKQAMENMKKIKSESNRLLREKEVSLPYHRPKSFSLKDILSRRKPAVAADGKALPIKMNKEQLKQYAQMLEQRQKEIMDLCKSDSEEEQSNNEEPSINVNSGIQSLEEDKNLAANVFADEPNVDHETSLQEKIENNSGLSIHLVCAKTPQLDSSNNEVEKTVLDKSSHMEVGNKNCLDGDEIIAVHSNLNTVDCLENTEINKENNHIKETLDQIINNTEKAIDEQAEKTMTEPESQILNLHYDSENTFIDKIQEIDKNTEAVSIEIHKDDENTHNEDDFSDGDIDMEDIDNLIENAEILKDASSDNNAKVLPQTAPVPQLLMQPKLTGAPGMVIDLDESDSSAPKKLSGVELLKERFTYFSKLKTPEELEREKEKKLKPGAQHLKLKHELEEIIAEQRSLEWAKRLNEEKQQQMELKALRGEDSDAENDIEKIEAQIDENDVEHEETSEDGESEPEEEDIEIKDKPRTKNPMIDDEADESDCDNDPEQAQTDIVRNDTDVNEEVDEDDDLSSEEESSEDSSEDEMGNEITSTRKGRILKAFEDSDDETENNTQKETFSSDSKPIDERGQNDLKDKITVNESDPMENNFSDAIEGSQFGSQILKDSQDDDIQLAQRVVSGSDDLFTSQESGLVVPTRNSENDDEIALGTQTFSILNPSNKTMCGLSDLESSQKMSDTQISDSILDVAVPVCSETFTECLIPSHLSSSQDQGEQSQPIGEDVLALCTGNFYDNQFISQTEENNENGMQETGNVDFDESWSKGESQDDKADISFTSSKNVHDNVAKDNNDTKGNDALKDKSEEIRSQGNAADKTLLQSIIDELHDEDKQTALKPNKYFARENPNGEANNQIKKKFVIESDDELNEDATQQKKKKKIKKRKLEQRALQISDDEQEESDEAEEYMSELENETDRIVEYDSEENEIEVKQQNPKKKRKMADFFENEAELTSEDEWVGSGDEDEAGLDRMEREEGDDETFHQGKLQRELGQIHMRDVLDQDKREVRIIQELLFEDGDLGDGHRQRKFRWKDADGAEEPDTIVDDFADTQEEEFESEEQWRKQRHEREVFLRQMKEQGKTEDSPNVTLNRSTIIKANLSSKSMSSLVLEVNKTTIKADIAENSIIKEKSVKDIPSPKRGFAILQQNYHSSLLTRGRGALARLAALATPLAVDEDSKLATVAPQNQRNFVFATVAKDNDKPKVMKRKADSKVDTPRLVKKLRTNDKKTLNRNSLLDHLKI